ncbi:MAG: hypothetical protein J0I91_02450 [Candidatus Accumulibacter sp.]|nr:hypothetical protein [Accumulibacter sp.]
MATPRLNAADRTTGTTFALCGAPVFCAPRQVADAAPFSRLIPRLAHSFCGEHSQRWLLEAAYRAVSSRRSRRPARLLPGGGRSGARNLGAIRLSPFAQGASDRAVVVPRFGEAGLAIKATGNLGGVPGRLRELRKSGRARSDDRMGRIALDDLDRRPFARKGEIETPRFYPPRLDPPTPARRLLTMN